MNFRTEEEQETSVRTEGFEISHDTLYRVGLVGEQWAERKADQI
jgi:hypothetical protein